MTRKRPTFAQVQQALAMNEARAAAGPSPYRPDSGLMASTRRTSLPPGRQRTRQ